VEVADLHRLLREVPSRAIEVNADSSLFPDDWLFRWRWDKGKKKSKGKKKEKGLQSTLDVFVSTEESQSQGESAESLDIKPKALEFLALVSSRRVRRANYSRMVHGPPSPSSQLAAARPRSSPSYKRCRQVSRSNRRPSAAAARSARTRT
jgi:formamidopyrimidine-DNA glycosylase